MWKFGSRLDLRATRFDGCRSGHLGWSSVVQSGGRIGADPMDFSWMSCLGFRDATLVVVGAYIADFAICRLGIWFRVELGTASGAYW